MEEQNYAPSQLLQKDGHVIIDELTEHLKNLTKLRWYWFEQGKEGINFNIAAKNVIELTRRIFRVRRVRRLLKMTANEYGGIEGEYKAALLITILMSASIGTCLIFTAQFQIPANHIYGGMLIIGAFFAGLRLYCFRRGGHTKCPK